VEAGATEIGESIGSVFFDAGRTPGATYWYYIRHVNANGEKGAFTEREQAADEIGTADIADDAVTFGKLQNIAADRLLGRTTASTGSVEELTAAAVRTLLNVADGADVSPVSSVAGKTGAVTLAIADIASLQSTLDDKLKWVSAPASASASGTAGQIAYDANYIYVCTATDTWKRVAIATW
jgi:hypothetical protein